MDGMCEQVRFLLNRFGQLTTDRSKANTQKQVIKITSKGVNKKWLEKEWLQEQYRVQKSL